MDMTLTEVAAFIGKSVYQTRRYMEGGLLTARKDGKSLYFKREEVVAFAQSRGLRTSDITVISEPITPERARELMARAEGYVGQYVRKEIDVVSAAQGVIAASGTILKAPIEIKHK